MRTIKAGEDLREALREGSRDEALSTWMKDRAASLLSSVTARDVLTHFGVDLKGASDQEEQISCPFHGQDRKPSARVYPEGSTRSGVYCWVCQERWDIFGLWKQFHGDQQMKFGEVLRGLEGAFGILPPDKPVFNIADESTWGPSEEKAKPSQQEDEANALLELCEKRLRLGKDKFTMVGFLTVGRLLDKLHYAVQHKEDLPTVEAKARAILEKIGEKIRA